MTTPTVSICCQVYNHSKFIAQALDGFLAQETSFNIEILINDDASTDGTQEIIKKYQSQYPEIIKPKFHTENQWSKGKKPFSEFNLPRVEGKYIALCEGDDYWTDPLKLQKQVDFLESHPDFSITHHKVKIDYESGEKQAHLSNINQAEETTILDLAQRNYIHTVSCLFRTKNVEIPEWFKDSPVGDYPLHMLNAQHGKIKFFEDVMAVYRIHGQGLWGHTKHLTQLTGWKKVLEFLISYGFSDEVSSHLKKQYFNTCLGLIKSEELELDQKLKTWEDATKQIPAEDIVNFVAAISEENNILKQEIDACYSSTRHKIGSTIVNALFSFKHILKWKK